MARCGILDGLFLLKRMGDKSGDRYIGMRVTEEFPSKLGADPEKITRDATGLWLVRTNDRQTRVAIPYRGYFVKKVHGADVPGEVFYVEKGSEACRRLLVIPEGGSAIAGDLETLGAFERPEDFRKEEERIAEVWG